MRKLSKKTIVCFLFLVFSILSLTYSAAQGKVFVVDDESIFKVSFISAEYLDADGDGHSDDTRFDVEVYYNPEVFDGSRIKMDCYFDIILPSNTTYSYFGFVQMYSITSIVRFDVYDTVTESGWYTINFDAYVKVKMLSYHSFCTTIFDPPTGHGEGGGTPTMDF
ncbi:MAG: hypothetical protein GF308_20735 [Candidatus Heimdallarchaeota archaeon]|nr:hypothetical protein [Candidatus Heimdallarchaeota archaeon]